MRAKHFILLKVAVALAIGTTYAVGAITTKADDGPPVAADAFAIREAAPGINTSEIDRRIALFEERVTAGHDGVATQRHLGLLYFQKARFTDDLGAYVLARDAYERVAALDPSDLDTVAALARSALALHDFAAASRLAQQAYAADHTRFDALLTMADTALAVGDYRIAAERIAALDDALPGQPVVQTRLARLAHLNGDAAAALDTAAAAERLAEDQGLLGAELAFYRTVHGRIAFDLGEYELAAGRFARAVAEAPDWAIARGGLAQAEAALGDTEEAIALYRRIVEATSDPPFVAALADLLAVSGDADGAADLYDAVAAVGRPTGIDGEVHAREYARIYADLDVHHRLAVELATAGLAGRDDAEGHDVLAWTLYRAGRLHDARAASDRALALATPNAPMLYHAGLISAALGDADRATDELGQAIDLSPGFDPVRAEHARGLLAGLTGTTGTDGG
jgi:tetratricopeptide (TPR) repeat protein